MKFTAIFANDGNDEWSTPLSIVNEFKARGWDTEIISIGSNKTGIYHDHNLKKWLAKKDNTNIVMLFDFGRFDSVYLDKALKSDSFWVQESGDDPQNFDRNFSKSHKFDMIVTPDYDSYLSYKKLNRNAEWQTHFADTNVHFPSDVPIKYVAVTTRGKNGSQFLDRITEHSKGAIGNKNGMNSIEHTNFLNSGLMVIQNSRFGEITRRIFEGMLCGKLVLTDRLNISKKLDKLFTHKKDIVFYDNIVDCLEKINYYHTNSAIRAKIAKAGMLNVSRNHTQRNRVDFLIKKYNNYDAMGCYK